MLRIKSCVMHIHLDLIHFSKKSFNSVACKSRLTHLVDFKKSLSLGLICVVTKTWITSKFLQTGFWNSNWIKTWILTYIIADWVPVFHPGTICREIHRCCSPFHSSQVFKNFKMKNKFQHTKSDSEIRGFQQINVSSEISKTSSLHKLQYSSNSGTNH